MAHFRKGQGQSHLEDLYALPVKMPIVATTGRRIDTDAKLYRNIVGLARIFGELYEGIDMKAALQKARDEEKERQAEIARLDAELAKYGIEVV